MQTYQDTKDSGVDWIGEIPAEWDISKIGYEVYIDTGNSIKDDEKANYEDESDARPYISSKDIDVETANVNYDNGLFIKLDDKKFKVAKKNTTLLCIEGGSAGRKIAYINQDVSFVNKLCNFDFKGNYQKYLFYYLRSRAFKDEFHLNLTGLIGGVSKQKLSSFTLPMPSNDTQQRIADYLDVETGKIDNLIAKQQNLLELLEEKRRATITHAVTRVNNSVEERIRDICSLNPKCVYSFEDSEEVNFYPMESIGDDGSVNHNETRSYADVKSGYTVFQNGDILTAKVTPCFENYKGAYITNISSNTGFGTTELFVLRAKSKVDPEYLYWITQSKNFNDYLAGGMRGTGGLKRVVPEEFKNYKVKLPTIDEQREIVAGLKNKLDRYLQLKQKIQIQIDLLRERRTSLITAAVTGKVKIT